MTVFFIVGSQELTGILLHSWQVMALQAALLKDQNNCFDGGGKNLKSDLEKVL